MNGIKGMTTQNRLIILGLLSTTIVMLCLTCFAVNKIKKDLDTGYKNFGQIISKTLAIESVEITKDIPELSKYDTLRSHSLSILGSNDDIAFIEFKDNVQQQHSCREEHDAKSRRSQLCRSIRHRQKEQRLPDRVLQKTL